MPRYNLRSGAAAQEPPMIQSANFAGSVGELEEDLNETLHDAESTMPTNSDNDKLSAIISGLNELTRTVSESRREIDSLRRQVQQQHIYCQSIDGSLQRPPPEQYLAPTLPNGTENQAVMNAPMDTPPFTSNSSCKIYDLPIFSGKPQEWPLFYANFKDSSKEFNYSHRHNLMRLQKCLVGEAKEAVESMLIYPNDVPNIIEELEFRFGRPDLLVRSQLQIIQHFPQINSKKLDQIIIFATKVRNVVTFLNSANCSHHLVNSTLLEELVSKLPMDKQYEWAKASIAIKPYPTITDFSNWIGELAKVVSVMSVSVPQNNHTRPLMLIEQHNQKQNVKCCICQGPHTIAKCKVYAEELSINNRWEKVKELRLCFCCLKKGHGSGTCRSKKPCGINSCKRPHHPTLHESNLNEKPRTKEIQPLLNCRGHHIEAEDYAIFDEGSSISLMDERIARQLGLKGPQSTLSLQWYGDNVVTEKSSKISCEIEGNTKIRYNLRNLYTVYQYRPLKKAYMPI